MSDYQTYIDGLILKALRDDDEQPLSHLFSFYYNRLLRAGLRWCADSYLTEECIQEVFLDLWRYRHSLGDVLSLEAYLKTALKRRIFKRLNKLDPSEQATSMDNWSEMPSAMSTESYEEILIQQQTDDISRERLLLALEHLSPRQKEIIHLKYFEELSYKDISERLDAPIGAVYKLLHDAVKKLKTYLGLLCMLFFIC